MTGSAGKIVAIAVTGLRRLFRERSSIFFVLIFPVVLVLVIGSVFGGRFAPGLGVVTPAGDPLADELADALAEDDSVTVERYDSRSGARGAVERGAVQAAVVIPEGYGAQLRDGGRVEVEFLARPGLGATLRTVVEAVVRDQAVPLQAAQFGAAHGAGTFSAALDEAVGIRSSMPAVPVRTTTVGDELFPESLGRFDLGASQQMLLFMFVTSLAGAAALIQTRQLGVARRMLSTPTSAGVALAGEALGRFALVTFQGAYIMVATWLLFGVDWGAPAGAVALLLAFALVATGVAMLAGAVFRNDQQAGSFGVMLGLGLAALGGSMAPLEIFSPTMRTIAHITPHAWALDGFAELVREDGTVVDILPELAVLLAMGTVLLALGTALYRRSITSP